MILILGCGRSGTHALAEVLTSRDTMVEVENPIWFDLALAMVRNEETKSKYLSKFIKSYLEQIKKAEDAGKIFVDKTHVAAWFLEELLQVIPSIKTIWIERDPLASIASMKKHPGMKNDLRYARCFSVPNRFMGIFDEFWFDLPIVKCFAFKWVSYRIRLCELQTKCLIDHVVRYEDLVNDPNNTVYKIEKKFNILCSRPFMNPESLTKWKTVLSDVEINDIQSVIGEYDEKY